MSAIAARWLNCPVAPLVLLPEGALMSAHIYPDVNTSSVSSGAANKPVRRQGASVNTTDQLSSPVLLGIAVAGSVVAALLIQLVNG
jgi:hypothetical protein